MDQLAAMRAFLRVADTGSFTKAAESLQMPKPTLTKLVQNLETHLHTKLLHRTTRRVQVTSDGAAYYDRVARVLVELDDIDASMSNARACPKGRLRVEAPSSLATLVILPALSEFLQEYPSIQVDLGVSDRPVDMIGDNIDCAVRAGEVTDESMVARHIGEVHAVACATPAYLREHGTPSHPSELEDRHTMVSYFLGGGRQKEFVFAKDAERITVRGRYRAAVNDSNAYLAAGLAGLGIIQVPTFMVQQHLSSGALQPVLCQWISAPKPIYLVYPPNRHLSTRVRVFANWVTELFANHDLIQRRSTLRMGESGLTPLCELMGGLPMPHGAAASEAQVAEEVAQA
ncbi:LysR family transcriptional regulator [Caldimonas brevitalea]|uniref:Transcriptional regulator, LysR family n=1 Tax=Caldimonas brevitalea TaxID=413882 RepID=A0A0G3BPI0_9BURK|nr:LysR family transcriptional regulator [Caldimonas brevitalea]AKJ29888.1 transcriptional regulator, LysR family [Caldimonas brevitalea]